MSPNGVHPDHTSTYLAQIATKRAAKQFQDPAHTMGVLYRYNSLNQVVVQSSPDGNVSHFWYDRLGRLALSQDSRQATTTSGNPKYSYTQYDGLGRITWVAEKVQPLVITNAIVRNPTAFLKWIEFRNDISQYQPQDMIQTVYDAVSAIQSVYSSVTPFRQKSWTLRNRVSYQRYYEILPSSMSVTGTDTTYTPNYAYYTGGVDYSYDIHGNVDSLLNIYNRNLAMNFHGAQNKYKLIAYNYDLISGKVNTVHYNPDNVDEFYHRYSYDAENRLTDVYTTDTRMFQGQESLEDHDAHYEYYRHGPMSRQLLGQQQVQGLDYTYTLQGWIKGVNTTTLDRLTDIGKDGQNTARDAFSYNLNYFSGDYQPINNAKPYADHETAVGITYRPMYNGNINSMAVNIRQFDQPQLYAYKYDQLNRIKAMDVYRHTQATMAGNSWTGSTFTQEYRERVTYDPNGNILSYFRNGSGSSPGMDNLNYTYYPNTNRLRQITDGVADAAYAADLDNQAANNYVYDNAGNLDMDVKNRIDDVTWNVYGKIKKLSKAYPPTPAGSTRYIDYVYDVFGNRLSKWQYKAIGTEPSGTFYVRDAQGNIMAEYEKETAANSTTFPMVLKRHYIYGSSRLGQIDRNQDIEQPKLTVVNESLIGPAIVSTFSRGKKYYELSNHLGNVLVTVSDRKFGPQDLAGHTTPPAMEYADPEVVTANDYYPFGMLMNGRNYNKAGSGDYKFGFNGKENDNDVNGEGTNIDFGARMYDSRAARWFSIDPLQRKYAGISPFCHVENNPMVYSDLDGKDKWINIIYVNEQTGQKSKLSILVSHEIKPKEVRKYTDNATIEDSYDWNDIDLNYNITVGKNGKVTASFSEGEGKTQTNTWFKWPWKAKANIAFNNLSQKEGKIGAGYFMTGEGSGAGDPLGPSATEVQTIQNADALISMLGGGGATQAGNIEELTKGGPEGVISILESLTKSFEAGQKAGESVDLAKTHTESTEESPRKAKTSKDNPMMYPESPDKNGKIPEYSSDSATTKPQWRAYRAAHPNGRKEPAPAKQNNIKVW